MSSIPEDRGGGGTDRIGPIPTSSPTVTTTTTTTTTSAMHDPNSHLAPLDHGTKSKTSRHTQRENRKMRNTTKANGDGNANANGLHDAVVNAQRLDGSEDHSQDATIVVGAQTQRQNQNENTQRYGRNEGQGSTKNDGSNRRQRQQGQAQGQRTGHRPENALVQGMDQMRLDGIHNESTSASQDANQGQTQESKKRTKAKETHRARNADTNANRNVVTGTSDMPRSIHASSSSRFKETVYDANAQTKTQTETERQALAQAQAQPGLGREGTISEEDRAMMFAYASHVDRRRKSKQSKKENEADAARELEKTSKPKTKPLAAPAEDHPLERTANIAKMLKDETYECLICYESIKRDKAIWSCTICGVIVHLFCIKKWAKSASTSNDQNSDWRCPACQSVVDTPLRTLKYVCFCGKRKDPQSDPSITPHSCGDICGKLKGGADTGCTHVCRELCHPAKCAPCVVQLPPRPCFCGKALLPRKCGDSAGFSCNAICTKVMKCGHTCQQPCHLGECSVCSVSTPITCLCGKETVELPCDMQEQGLSCGKECNKVLACGNHDCKQICGHKGSCDICPTDPQKITTCGCGKVEFSTNPELFNVASLRKSCLDPLPSCGQVCAKPLSCLKEHNCSLICGHVGDHEKCTKVLDVPCRCGSKLVPQVVCGAPPSELRQLLICDRPCDDMLPCRRHKCQNLCCPLRKLSTTGKKKMAPGLIGIVTRVREVTKLRNGEYIAAAPTTPLGSAEELSETAHQGQQHPHAEQLISPHTCNVSCNRLLNCGIHYCDHPCGSFAHFSNLVTADGVSNQGVCPPCGRLIHEPLSCYCGRERIPSPYRCGTKSPKCIQRCNRVRPCGHQCNRPCFEHEDGTCGRCSELVRKVCVGGHEARFAPCFANITCSRQCGKPLLCGIHACPLPCHSQDEPCYRSETAAFSDGCGLICGLARGECKHPCQEECHGNEPCPDVICNYLIDVSCKCGRRTDRVPCLQGGTDKLIDDYVEVKEVNGIRMPVRLRCDGECEVKQRNENMAKALEIDINAERTYKLSSTAASASASSANAASKEMVYSSFLLETGSREPQFVQFLEFEYAALVNGQKNEVRWSDLPALHRLVAHELSVAYGLETESKGNKSNRYMEVRRPALSASTSIAGASSTFGFGSSAKSQAPAVPRIPHPKLSEACTGRKQQEKERRLSKDRRCICITIKYAGPGAKDIEMDDVAYTWKTEILTQVHKLLKSHLTYYKVYSISSLDPIEPDAYPARVKVIVEFTTAERAQSVFASLAMKPGIHIRQVMENELHQEDILPSTMNISGVEPESRPKSEASSRAASAKFVSSDSRKAVTSAWDD